MRKPRVDSYKYLIRCLHHKESCPAKKFIEWLEVHKPLCWLKDAEKMIYRTTVYLRKPLLLQFIPETVQPELRQELLYHLQQMKNYSLHLKIKRDEYQRQLKLLLNDVPPQEVEFLQGAFRKRWTFKHSLEQSAELEEFLAITEFGIMGTFEQVRGWLAKNPIERTAIINRIMYLQGLLNIMLKAKEAEQQRIYEERERQHKREWSETYNTYGSHSFSGGAYSRFRDELKRYAGTLDDCFIKLGLQSTATKADVKRAFRALAQIHHPDKCGGSDEKFKELNNAYTQALQCVGD